MDTTAFFRRTFGLLTATALLVGTSGCASMSNTERGAAVGAGAGGVAGAVIGNAAGSTTKGAIIGAVLGGAAGAVIGSQMDEKAEELDDELEGADVERVGEGILVTFDSGILFDFDSSALRPEARTNLDNLTRVLADRADDYTVMVAGHTDSVGSEQYNLELSRRRAETAAGYLRTRGIPGARLDIVALGESEPVASNSTEAGRQENRRVEVAIFASEEYRSELERRYGN